MPVHDNTTNCELPTVRPETILAVLVVGTFLAPLDSSIVNIALPSIAAGYGRSLAEVSWVTTAYLLTSASLLLSMGRLGDVLGLRWLYVWGLIVFGIGSTACAFAPSLALLIGARILQAVGAAMLFAAGPALVARTFPPQKRGWALGFVSLAVSAGLTVGPALGGLLVGTFGWQSIFVINIPLSAVVAVIAVRLLPKECRRDERFDIPGALLGGASLLLVLLGMTAAERESVWSVAVLGPVAASALLACAFVWWERRSDKPMVDLGLFRSKAFSLGIVAATLAYLSLFAATFTMPFFLLRILGLNPRVAGLVLTVTPLSMAVLAPLAGRASDVRGSRGLSTGGLVVVAAGLLGASFLGPHSAIWQVGIVLAVLGSGMSLFQTPNTAAVLRATPRQNAGVGSAMIAEARNVGMSLGIALTAAVVGARTGAAGSSAVLSGAAALSFSAGMSNALRIGSAIALVGGVLSWWGHDGREPQDS